MKQEDATHTVEGTVEAISLQNINKARGHYTYLVNMDIAPISTIPIIDPKPKTIQIRVDKIYWGNLSKDRQTKLAPEGPKSRLSIQQYANYNVGEVVKLKLKMTSFGDPPIGWIAQ